MQIKYEKPVVELIRIRKSVRTHTGEAIELVKRDVLSNACASIAAGFLDDKARFGLVEKTFEKGKKVRLGNYGLQKNPRYFFVGAIVRSETALVSYGYLLEHLILKATDLELGTCWIGFFDRKFFHDFKLAENEIFPATCTVGDPAGRRLFEKISRIAVKADLRKDPEKLFFQGDFQSPLALADAGNYAIPLEMVRLAPSSGNSQPWRILKEPGKNVYHFFLKKISSIYFNSGLHHIDMGIALCHFELAAREAGLGGQWEKGAPAVQPVPPETTYIKSWIGV